MTSDPLDTESLPPDLVSETVLQNIGPYKILEILGEGAMGTVYLAERTKPMHQRVALKIISWVWTPSRSWPASRWSAKPWP